jgi:hypothetical protein
MPADFRDGAFPLSHLPMLTSTSTVIFPLTANITVWDSKYSRVARRIHDSRIETRFPATAESWILSISKFWAGSGGLTTCSWIMVIQK